MPLSSAEIAHAGEALYQAEKNRHQIGLLSLRHPNMDMEDAYAIQSVFTAHKQAAGCQIIGWKIGLTSKAMQAALSIDIPDSGVLFDDMPFPSGGIVPQERFIEPRIEAEIAFGLKAPLAGHVTRKEVLAATDYVVPSLEILDTRIQRQDPQSGKRRILFDTIADNAANAGIVLGNEQHSVETHDLRWVGVIVSRNGEVEETGLGAGVLNDPVESIVWLAKRMAHYGQQIEAGQIILSGSFIRPVECPPGSSIDADFGTFGRVEIRFE